MLARAFYKRPQILLLDEGTANLDQSLEVQVNQTLTSLGKTVVLVAHRPEVLSRANRIFNLCDGRLTGVELGRARGPGARVAHTARLEAFCEGAAGGPLPGDPGRVREAIPADPGEGQVRRAESLGRYDDPLRASCLTEACGAKRVGAGLARGAS